MNLNPVPLHALLVLIAVTGLAAVAPAQWVDFADQTSVNLVASPSLGASDLQEKDYAWGDVDQDGDVDLVCVRKQPWTTQGRFANVVFMNENGVLTDLTAQYASASSVPGSSGFLDLTNDRDVVLTDVTGDGWLDCITATTLSGSQPKYISHPRVYVNLGVDGTGSWLGFTFDDENRFPTMPAEPRFCSIGHGDIDNDGDVDIYMGDYQQGGSRPVDVNDRLFINDGTGYFTDESSSRMTTEMLESSFAMASVMADMNLDGKLDILKDDALNAPQGVSISYNNGSAPGFFGTYSIAYAFSPYHVNTGDLNNDNQPDFIVSDDGSDRYQLSTGVSPAGLATFAAARTFSFSGGGSDDGFGGNNLIVDLNNDGWKDVIITDVDVDISGCGRRTHIYRNLGDAPNVTLQEQLAFGEVAGIPTSFLTGTHDVAVFDINGDGWNDMVVGRCTGTQVWINQPPIGLAFSYPQGLPGFIPGGSPFDFQIQVTGIGGSIPASSSVQLLYSINGTPFQPAVMANLGGNVFQATIPGGTNCTDEVRFYTSAQTTLGQSFTDPPTAPGSWYEAVVASGTSITYEDGFESGPGAWTVDNSPALSSGAWEVAQPNGTINAGQFAAPNEDAEASAQSIMCWVTENGAPGGSAGVADVDGGPTDLISPPLNLAGTDARITYSRWFYSSGAGDVLTVWVSPDANNWQLVETVSNSGNNIWTVASFRVGDFIVPSATTQVRFRTADLNPGSICEAGIDLFRVEEFVCQTCQPDLGFAGPGNSALSLCGGDLSSGTTADLLLTGAPSNTLAYLGVAASVSTVPFAGGTVITVSPLFLLSLPTDGQGSFLLAGIPGGNGPVTVYAQAVYADPTLAQGVGISNAIQANWLP